MVESEHFKVPYSFTHSKRCLSYSNLTVVSEAAFSTSGRVLDPFRSSLTLRIVEALVCTQDWFRGSSKVNVEESVEELEKDISILSIHI